MICLHESFLVCFPVSVCFLLRVFQDEFFSVSPFLSLYELVSVFLSLPSPRLGSKSTRIKQTQDPPPSPARPPRTPIGTPRTEGGTPTQLGRAPRGAQRAPGRAAPTCPTCGPRGANKAAAGPAPLPQGAAEVAPRCPAARPPVPAPTPEGGCAGGVARSPPPAARARRGSPTSGGGCRTHAGGAPVAGPPDGKVRARDSGASCERGMPGRSWAVQRNQDKVPRAAKPPEEAREGEAPPAEHPNPPLPGAAVPARPPQAGRGLGPREAWAAGRQELSDPTGGPGAPAPGRAGRGEGGVEGPCLPSSPPQPLPGLAIQ